MRQSGRTTKIVKFTIEQLQSVCEVIITDHIVYEFKDCAFRTIIPFIKAVHDAWKLLDDKYQILEHGTIKVHGKWLVHFKLTHKTI